MRRSFLSTVALAGGAIMVLASSLSAMAAGPATNWPQWGQNAQHHGFVNSIGQALNGELADVTYDPFAPAEIASTGGELLVHYQAPLIEENNVFMEFETGPNLSDITNKTWHEKRLHWEGSPSDLVTKWDFASDWQPESLDFSGGWEAVFHAALSESAVFVPGAGGTIFQLNKGTGQNLGRINPFGSTIDPNTFVAGPLTVDSGGNVFYNALKLDPNTLSVVDSWLVKVDTSGGTSKVSYQALVPNAPTTCVRAFGNSLLPWPAPAPGGSANDQASATRLPPSGPCGIQRVGLNVAPAVAPDGTIYSVSRADFNSRYSFVLAVNPDLTSKWAASLRDHLNDGCGVLIPIATQANPLQKGKCRWGATVGVDPQTNQQPAGRVIDQSTSSPTVAPDGSVIYGSYSRYNVSRGHLWKFSSSGDLVGLYDFGWDSTTAVRSHDGTYSIVIKDNHYDEEEGFYCNNFQGNPDVANIVCAFTGVPAGPFYITQLNANLIPEWKFHSIETNSCTRNPNGTLSCVSDHPNGFEWCVNGDVIDGNGTVYANSEDGNLYAIPQGHTGIFDISSPDVHRIFLKLAVGAAYTPTSIAPNGLIYTENDGVLFVIGAGGRPVGRSGGHPGPHTGLHLPEPEVGA